MPVYTIDKLTNLDEPVIVGVVYRPPSGDTNLFQSEFRDVLSSLPADHSVHILGDYNVDLLSESHNDTVPLISTHTHQRGEFRKTIITDHTTSKLSTYLDAITQNFYFHCHKFIHTTHYTHHVSKPSHCKLC